MTSSHLTGAPRWSLTGCLLLWVTPLCAAEPGRPLLAWTSARTQRPEAGELTCASTTSSRTRTSRASRLWHARAHVIAMLERMTGGKRLDTQAVHTGSSTSTTCLRFLLQLSAETLSYVTHR